MSRLLVHIRWLLTTSADAIACMYELTVTTDVLPTRRVFASRLLCAVFLRRKPACQRKLLVVVLRSTEAGRVGTRIAKWLYAHNTRARQRPLKSLRNPNRNGMHSAECVAQKWSWPSQEERQLGDRHAATAGILTMSTPRWCDISATETHCS